MTVSSMLNMPALLSSVCLSAAVVALIVLAAYARQEWRR